MVRIGRIGIAAIAVKAHELLPIQLTGSRNVHHDPNGAAYFEKTWSLQSSGHGRFSVCHGQYGGYVTNASIETLWRDRNHICPPTAPLGTYIGALMHEIAEMGAEHQTKLVKAGHANAFVSIPKNTNSHWDWIMSCHPKTLVASVFLELKSAEKKLT
jgi:hypothetical protein